MPEMPELPEMKIWILNKVEPVISRGKLKWRNLQIKPPDIEKVTFKHIHTPRACNVD